jgi:hypothetical protein
MKRALADGFRPIAPPQVMEGVYTEDQCRRLLNVAREKGPWPNVMSTFKSPQQLVARYGPAAENRNATWDDLLVPIYRGTLAKGGTCLYPEIDDCFFNPLLLSLARKYWDVKLARPEQMLFNVQGPCDSFERPHFDSVSFRGITQRNAPIWLTVIMAKSGLFASWLAKKAQVITWFYRGAVGGGFTYWPDGPYGRPKRVHAPMWNRGVVVQNELMFHMADGNGPIEMRSNKALTIQSKMDPDPEHSGDWRITSDDVMLRRIPASEVRFMFHWGCEVYTDESDLSRSLEGSDDLSLDQVFDMFIEDLRAKGITCRKPPDPVNDVGFIKLLTNNYQLDAPTLSPEEDAALNC